MTLPLNKDGNRRGMARGDISGPNNPNWKGGEHKRKDGYHLVRDGFKPSSARGARYKLLHRIVMEKHLGRSLRRDEVVHHKNGNKGDNRTENLEIITQAEHALLHIRSDRKRNNLGQLT